MTPTTVSRPDADPVGEGGVQAGLEGYPEGSKRLANGTIVGPNGRFLPGVRPTSVIASREQAQIMGRKGAERRRELAGIYARKHVTQAMQEGGLDAKGPAEAVGMMAGEFARSALANAMDKPRDAVHAAKLALKLADMLPEDQRAAAGGVQVLVAVSGGPELEAVDASWSEAHPEDEE